MADVLKAHIEQCPKHPLFQARGTIARYQKIINYWFPLLGYEQANEMSYPALGDRRAKPSPVLLRSSAQVLVEEALQFSRSQQAAGRCVQCAHPWYDGVCSCGSRKAGDGCESLMRRICEHPLGRDILRSLP